MLETLKTLPSEHAERYLLKINRYLKSDYEHFLKICKQQGLRIHRDLLPENGGFEKFEKRAFELDYKLGLKPCVEDGEKVANFSTIIFKTKTIHLKDGKRIFHHPNGKKSCWFPVKNSEGISGFGITLNLLGWSRFTGINIKELDKRLKGGESIDLIFKPKNGSSASSRFVQVDGEKMTTSAACEKCGISRTAFQNRVKGIDDDSVRQSVFDKMRSETKEDQELNFKIVKDRYWIAVDECDFNDIVTISKRYNVAIPFIINRLVSLGKREIENNERKNSNEAERSTNS